MAARCCLQSSRPAAGPAAGARGVASRTVTEYSATTVAASAAARSWHSATSKPAEANTRLSAASMRPVISSEKKFFFFLNILSPLPGGTPRELPYRRQAGFFILSAKRRAQFASDKDFLQGFLSLFIF